MSQHWLMGQVSRQLPRKGGIAERVSRVTGAGPSMHHTSPVAENVAEPVLHGAAHSPAAPRPAAAERRPVGRAGSRFRSLYPLHGPPVYLFPLKLGRAAPPRAP